MDFDQEQAVLCAHCSATPLAGSCEDKVGAPAAKLRCHVSAQRAASRRSFDCAESGTFADCRAPWKTALSVPRELRPTRRAEGRVLKQDRSLNARRGVIHGAGDEAPDDVAEMLRLKACGWGLKPVGRQLGCTHHTVEGYVAAGGVKAFKSPERPKRLDNLEGWLRERLILDRRNADVVRQDLLTEKGVTVSRRTLQREMQPYPQALKAEALATTRFETPPDRQLQIDFGERLVEIKRSSEAHLIGA